MARTSDEHALSAPDTPAGGTRSSPEGAPVGTPGPSRLRGNADLTVRPTSTDTRRGLSGNPLVLALLLLALCAGGYFVLLLFIPFGMDTTPTVTLPPSNCATTQAGRKEGLANANLVDCDLRGADLSRADLSGATLCRSNLRGANLRGANLTRADLQLADLTDANLVGANLHDLNTKRWTPPNELPTLGSGDFTRANLAGADLGGADLFRADLSNANLTNADLTSTRLPLANMVNVNLTNATLDKTDLSAANLLNATGPGNGAAASAEYSRGTQCSDGTIAESHGGTCAGVGAGW